LEVSGEAMRGARRVRVRGLETGCHRRPTGATSTIRSHGGPPATRGRTIIIAGTVSCKALSLLPDMDLA
jgi:hypothetical protein